MFMRAVSHCDIDGKIENAPYLFGYKTGFPPSRTELQIRGGIGYITKIIFLISRQKHTLGSLIRTVSAIRF